jgi:hypothetical protein
MHLRRRFKARSGGTIKTHCLGAQGLKKPVQVVKIVTNLGRAIPAAQI